MTTSLYAEIVRGGMKQITIDFETAWDATMGFGCQTTQEYVMDRRFEVEPADWAVPAEPPFIIK